jgi:ABC-2 type transport system permease protein
MERGYRQLFMSAMSSPISWARFSAVLLKEFVQMRRDRLTFAMIVGIPILQLALFGYAINTDPKALPDRDRCAGCQSVHAQPGERAAEHQYFRIVDQFPAKAEADRALQRGDASSPHHPADFSRPAAARGPAGPAGGCRCNDPAATGNALAALQVVAQRATRP